MPGGQQLHAADPRDHGQRQVDPERRRPTRRSGSCCRRAPGRPRPGSRPCRRPAPRPITSAYAAARAACQSARRPVVVAARRSALRVGHLDHPVVIVVDHRRGRARCAARPGRAWPRPCRRPGTRRPGSARRPPRRSGAPAARCRSRSRAPATVIGGRTRVPASSRSRSTCSSTASARVSIMVSRRLGERRARPSAGRHGDPAAAAISVSQARRNPSFSSAPCHMVPQTAPTRQPSRNGSRAASTVGHPVVDLVRRAPGARATRPSAGPSDLVGAEGDPHRQQTQPGRRPGAGLDVVGDLARQHLVAAADPQHRRSPPGPADRSPSASPRPRSQARSLTVARRPGQHGQVGVGDHVRVGGDHARRPRARRPARRRR